MAGVVTARRRGPSSGQSEQTGRILVPLLVPFIVLAAIAVYGALAPYNKTHVPPPGARGSLVWGDAIFANKRQFKAWLRLRGLSYRAWAKDHPAGVRLVTPRRRHHAALAKAHKKPAVRKVAVSQPRVTQSAQHNSGIWVVIGFGLMLGALAGTPQRLLARAGIRFGARERELRVAAIGAGAALLLGVIAATLLS